MRGLALILGIGGLGLVVAGVGLATWAQMPGGPLAVIGTLLIYAGAIGKLGTLIILGSLAVIAVSGGGALARAQGRASDALMVMAWIAVGAGLLSALYGAVNIQTAMVRTNTTSLMIIGPSVAEVLLIAGLGLIVGGLGLGLNAILKARAASA